MKTSSILLAALAGTSAAQDITAFNADTLSAKSAPNAVSMATLRQRKAEQRQRDAAGGFFDVDRYEAVGPSSCEDGKAGEYLCNNVDLLGFMRHQDTGSQTREGNDIWGIDATLSPDLLRNALLTACRLDRSKHWS